ncbi:efflux transporter outer membrane subunit [Roseiarcaceae bacterium H3SJ34-1]|uniref:efflux transporter outer membrane subunit n=1 Tax=Terripilifer ovatus TaxID=3032367 RepID=UPI003AB981B9|nr:efflux transporter outer membrane subunit [Roseiarcaceae bacterium H3SJ34-1]
MAFRYITFAGNTFFHKATRLSAVMALAGVLPACTVGPDFISPPEPTANRFLPDQKAAVIGRTAAVPRVVWGGDVPAEWWRHLGSPTLNRLIEDGIANNADLESAEAALRVAQTNITIQRAALFPLITAGFDSSRNKATNALSPPTNSNSYLYSLNTGQVNVSFLPDIWGGTRRQIESVKAQTRATAFQREAVYISLTANIALTAIMEASLRGQIAATNNIIGTQNQLLGILRRQYTGGQIAQTDVVAQETAVAQARLLLPPLERALGQQRNLLATLTGRFPDERIAANFTLKSFRLPRKVPLSLPADLVRSRPDIRLAEEHLHAANAQIGVAVANRLPQLALSANAGSSAQALSQLFSPSVGFWTLAGNLSQTVFDAGALAARQQGAEEATLQAGAQYRSTVLVAFQNVADVLRALQSDARALNAAHAAERSASQNIGLIRKQVDAGQISLPLLLTAQQAQLQASLARVQAEAQQIADTVALFQALGGGWWNRPNAVYPIHVEPPVTLAEGFLQPD